MQNREMQLLVLKHLADLDAAFKAGCEIDAEVFEVLGRRTKEWCDEHGWQCRWGNPWDVALSLWPATWPFDSDDKDDPKPVAYFAIGFGHDDTWDRDLERLPTLWVQRLCAVGGEAGLRFECNYSKLGMNKTEWKKRATAGAEAINATTGFSYESKDVQFFLPVVVSLNALQRGLETETIEDALQPYISAYERIIAAAPTFSKLLGFDAKTKSARK